MDDGFDDDIPLAQSSVTLQLEQIQRRCSELLEDDDALGGLSLEEPTVGGSSSDPYNKG